ncbi:SH3 domain-containing protein [Xanthobacter autotrophicus]|uniref:SH3 domain-containing protein n=1 Tax=Xanthobacter autotrophicus TaxID=280 RepID=UPI003736F43E
MGRRATIAVVAIGAALWFIGQLGSGSRPTPSSPSSPLPAVVSGRPIVPPAASPAPLAPPALSQIRPKPQEPARPQVRGSDVAFRSGPSRDAAIVDRLAKGLKVEELDRAGEWSKVRHPVTGREGWVFSRLLSPTDGPGEGDAAKPAKPVPEVKPPAAPALSLAIIAQRLIAESRASYPSSCACPYDTDRAGRRCGARSAYSKPGGYAPICYESDVTAQMVEKYRDRR